MKKERIPSTSVIDPRRLLGGLGPEAFLRDYWHKQPLLVRGAIPGFGGALTPEGLRELACHPDAESRLVRSARGRWRLDHGPFEAADLHRLPKRGWSLLASGVNHWLPDADALLHAFSFVPYARLDDVMVSLAPQGGGVGPHFDSYDVFLIQGHGARRWEISAQQDLELVEDAPLRILKRFHAEQSWVLEPGDMLYLPPRFAHNGVALNECMTWSVGFRAPSHQEIGQAFLAYLQDRIDLPGRYADPTLRRPRHPAALPADMVASLTRVIRNIRWDRRTIEEFLGCYLSEPKPTVFFDPPRPPLGEQPFRAAARRRGVRLDPRTRLLFHRGIMFINGERCDVRPEQREAIALLGDHRVLRPIEIKDDLCPLLYEWYRAGYLLPG
jgi:50S ribosomal protein L16 3-hydroxylase